MEYLQDANNVNNVQQTLNSYANSSLQRLKKKSETTRFYTQFQQVFSNNTDYLQYSLVIQLSQFSKMLKEQIQETDAIHI